MCAIVGSKSPDKFKELIKLNSYRGQHSHSYASFDIKKCKLTAVIRSIGEFDINKFDSFVDPDTENYYIGHIQAPTTEAKDISAVHPAEMNKSFLWHNGIIKAGKFGDYKWDTMYLLDKLLNGRLNDVDGQFSCVAYTTSRPFLKVFRNKISPMFYDDDLNLSSTKFEGSEPTLSEHVLDMHFDAGVSGMLINVESFKTVETPYFGLDL